MNVSWKDVDQYIAILVARIKKEEFTSLYAFPRGGLVAGVMLSHRLNLPLLSSPEDTSLLVDDIADSGLTLKPFVQKKATLIYKEGSVVVPDYYAFRIPSESGWIVFPWEV